MNCKSCFQPIADLRKENKCEICTSYVHRECAINKGGTFCDICYMENADKPLKPKTPDVIRRTYIETYRSCPYKFLKEVIEGNEQPPTCYTQIGIDLHEMFEECSNNFFPMEEMKKRMEACFRDYPDTLFEGREQRDSMYIRAFTSIENFYEVIKRMPNKPYVTEQTIEFSVGNDLPKVQFTMDRIDLVDGELEMHDWKTGKAMVGKKLSTDLQAPLYIYGTRLHYDMPVRSFTFHYLNEGKTRIFTRSPIDPNIYECRVRNRKYIINLQDSIREIQSVFNQITKGNFNIPRDTNKMFFTCKMCHIKKEGLCEGADVQSWYQSHNGQTSW